MIRAATTADVPVIHAMVRELADYERGLRDVRSTPEQLREALFGADRCVYALVAEEAGSAEPVGFALWFRNYSTWTGTHGMYLEDLFVRPAGRGRGHGRALLAALAAICVERGWQRFEWSVLDWNEPSVGFFGSLGAEPMDEWRPHRLSGASLRSLAATAEASNDAIPLPN